MALENSCFNDISNLNESNPSTQISDPLEGLGLDVSEPILYRLDKVVFAQPLINNTSDKNEVLHTNTVFDEETTHLDNVTVKKINGKRKKIYVELHDKSNLCCPMEDCNKTFLSTTLLKAHIRKVLYSLKTFTCEVCGAGFSAQYLLKRHSAVHGSEKVHCPVCKKMLSLRTNLLVHLRSHSDTRQHACSICGKRFLRKATLNMHASVHEDKHSTRLTQEVTR